MKPHRARTQQVRVGSVLIGGGAPVVVQSMTNTPTADARATLAQIRRLAAAGCEVVRVAVPDAPAAAALSRLTASSPLPVVADVHFDAALALAALQGGAAKIRINPGNLGLPRALDVARAAAGAGVPVRIGVNAGSVPERRRKSARTPDRLGRLMADMALEYAGAFSRVGCRDLVLSVKAADLTANLAAYRALASAATFPLHLGVTEAGAGMGGVVKSAAGLAPLLFEGIGDTVRVSLTGDPMQEIPVANRLLAATGVRPRGVEIIACPTCGRTTGDFTGLVSRT